MSTREQRFKNGIKKKMRKINGEQKRIGSIWKSWRTKIRIWAT